MFKKMFKSKYLVLSVIVLTVSIIGILRAANIVNVTNTKALELDGALYFGDSQDAAYTTLPTTLTGDSFGVKIPFYNASLTTLSKGHVIVASAAVNNTMYGSLANITSTTTVVGICDGTVISGAKGWMSVAGVAVVLTTGAVAVGDILVSTRVGSGAGGGSEGSVSGYAGSIASGATVEEGTVIGKALSKGTAAGGLTLIRLF